MPCCCKCGQSHKSSVSCLGRCDLPKHKCMRRHEVKRKPVPRYMGWLYTARDAPEHQLRCGWRPGHIFCPVLRRIEQHNGSKCGGCGRCSSGCAKPPCCKRSCTTAPRCFTVCPLPPEPPIETLPEDTPNIRIVRHAGKYTITTSPTSVNNTPSGPYPLKYVFNTDGDDKGEVKYSVEAKFNDMQFDYTCSQTSFVLDFTPPGGCLKKRC